MASHRSSCKSIGLRENCRTPMTTLGSPRLPAIALAIVLAFVCHKPAMAGEPGDSSKASFDVNHDQSSQNSADPSAAFFPAGQFQVGTFGSGGFGHGTETVTEEHTVHEKI